MKKQTLIYNDEVIEHKIDLFNRIEHILDTKFNDVPIDASTWLLFKEYFDMYGLRISRAYNSDNKNIYILLSDGRISTDINIDDEFRSLIKTKDQLYNFLYELETDYGIYNMLLEICPSEEQNEIGELYIIKEIIYDLQDYPWTINNDVMNAVNAVSKHFKPIFNVKRIFKGSIWSFISNAFIKKIFEGYESITSYDFKSVSTNIHIDRLTDDHRYTFKWICDKHFDPLDYLHSLLLDIQAHKQSYIFRSIVESIDIVNYLDCYIINYERLRLTVSDCYFGYDDNHALTEQRVRIGKIKLYEQYSGLKITFNAKIDENVHLDTYDITYYIDDEYMRINYIFHNRLISMCGTLKILLNKYNKYLI